MKWLELSDGIASGDAALNRRQGTLIVNAQNQLVGTITRGAIARALRQDATAELTVAETGSADLTVAFPDEPVHALSLGPKNFPKISRLEPMNQLQGRSPKAARL
jgi:hypothetical protein